MKKGAKLALVITSSILVLFGGSIGGILLYSARNITYEMGDPTVSGYISEITVFPPSYEGYILADVPLNISNNGLFDILDLHVTVKIKAQNFLLLQYETLLGEGSNDIGDILQGDSWSGTFHMNLTEYIATLAVSSGDMLIEVQFSLKMGFIGLEVPVNYELTQVEEWNGPFL